MDERFNMLSGVILQKPLDQCTLSELEEMASGYPYFSPAHFLLLKKKEEAGEDAGGILQKAMLYYQDPVSFEHFIHSHRTDERFLHEQESKPLPITPAFTPHPSPEPSRESKPTEEVAEPGIPAVPDKLVTQEPAVAAVSSTQEEALAFEPYHTVDYFASQGIRPSQEDPKDALGKQLKSFTEWLKTMKKLPNAASPATKPVDPVVEAMANRSVGDAVVVTEAMAEVWLKQGNKERAREIYRKLSLQDPSKSTYFAAKIDNLNAD